MTLIYEVEFAGTVLKVFNDYVSLVNKTLTAKMLKGNTGDKHIYFKDITSISFKEAGLLAGFIEFHYPGSNAETNEGVYGGVSNPNRFTFNKKNNEVMIEVKCYIEKKINESKIQIVNKVTDKVDQLVKLQQLLDSKAITEEEFNKLKKELIRG